MKYKTIHNIKYVICYGKKAAVDIIVTHQDTSSLEDDNMFACLTSDKCRILCVSLVVLVPCLKYIMLYIFLKTIICSNYFLNAANVRQ